MGRTVTSIVVTVLMCAAFFAAAKADAQDAGFKTSIEPLASELRAGKHGAFTSLLVEKNGRLIFEEYFGGADARTYHDIRSATKSITSLVVGIGVRQGLLKGGQERVFERLPELGPLTFDRDKSLTLDDLLTMRSGLACDDWVPASLGNEDKMYETRDWLRFWAALPRSHERGQHFSYCTGNAMAAAAMLEQVSGLPFDRFADKYLLRPLGIKEATWAKAPNGATDAGGHLQLRSRDLLKLGELVLNRGRFQGKQIISEEWVTRSTSALTPVYERRQKYGYFWWVDDIAVTSSPRPLRVIYAWGNGGTYLFIVPQRELVVVFTGKNFNSPLALLPQKWIGSTILAALKQ